MNHLSAIFLINLPPPFPKDFPAMFEVSTLLRGRELSSDFCCSTCILSLCLGSFWGGGGDVNVHFDCKVFTFPWYASCYATARISCTSPHIPQATLLLGSLALLHIRHATLLLGSLALLHIPQATLLLGSLALLHTYVQKLGQLARNV